MDSKKILILLVLFFFIALEIGKLKKEQKQYNLQLGQIKVGINYFRMKDGGGEKQTSLLLKELSNVRFLKFYLLSGEEEAGEYYIPKNVTRLIVYNNYTLNITKLTTEIIEHKIDILIYQGYDVKAAKILQTLNIKIIVLNRSSIFHWFYYNYIDIFRNLYIYYKNFSLVLNLIPIEGNYLYKKWGIKNAISFMDFMPFDIKNSKSSHLSSKNIIMFGRGQDPIKNFELGMKVMKFIVQEVPESKLFIVSSGELSNLKKLAEILDIKENVIFYGYRINLSDILQNSSLNLFLSYAEAFPSVLSESKIYGLPTILTGMEYLALFNGGTVVAENDFPKTIASIAIKILNNETYRKKLGKEARESIEKFKNEIIAKRWVEILKSVYKGERKIKKIIDKEEKIDKKVVYKILDKEVLKLKIRNPLYKFLETKNLFNFTYICNISNYIKKNK